MKIFDPKSSTNINPWFLLFIALFVAVTLHVRSKDPTYLGGLSGDSLSSIVAAG